MRLRLQAQRLREKYWNSTVLGGTPTLPAILNLLIAFYPQTGIVGPTTMDPTKPLNLLSSGQAIASHWKTLSTMHVYEFMGTLQL